MSFGGWGPPPQHSWKQLNYNWQSYASHDNVGPIRRNQWSMRQWSNESTWFRNTQSQLHRFDRNDNYFSQDHSTSMPSTSNSLPLQMIEFAKAELRKNSHVPGLQTGLMIRALEENERHKMKANNNDEKLANQNLIETLKLSVDISSEQIKLRWSAAKKKRNVKYVIEYTNLKTEKIKTIERDSTTLSCRLRVEAGEKYRVTVNCISLYNNCIVSKWEDEIKAQLSPKEQETIYHKCLKFIDRPVPNMHEFWVVYRCKPKIYWDEIHHFFNDVMQKYIKDDNGQPGNLINGKIYGLFFSARLLKDLSLPPSSPFGNVRMSIDAHFLLNPQTCNFYFADFYCNKDIHYVTIVVCLKESDTDRYCNEKLIKLNPYNNKLLKVIPPVDMFSPPRYFINYSVWVEIYYTEDVNLDVGKFDGIVATGAGTSRIGGLPNNKYCTACNLHPKSHKSSDENIECITLDDDDDDDVVELCSTEEIILDEDENADTDVLDTVRHIVDVVEKSSMTEEQLISSQDENINRVIDDMKKEFVGLKPVKMEAMNKFMKKIEAFVEDFKKERCALIRRINEIERCSS